jgi:hypothetical protein
VTSMLVINRHLTKRGAHVRLLYGRLAKPNKRLLSPLRGWDGLSAASRLQVRPKAGRYIPEESHGASKV